MLDRGEDTCQMNLSFKESLSPFLSEADGRMSKCFVAFIAGKEKGRFLGSDQLDRRKRDGRWQILWAFDKYNKYDDFWTCAENGRNILLP